MTNREHFSLRPKAELHLHLEGTLTPELYRAWSIADGENPDRGGPSPNGRYLGFRDFLNRYAEGCRRLLHRHERLRQLVRSWAASALKEQVVYAELTVSPLIFEKLGFPYESFADVLDEELENASKAGIETRVLLDSVRQWGPAAAARVLELHSRRPLPRAIAFGLAGEETSVPAREFREVYDAARALGLRTTLHAGEWGGADSIREGLDELGPDRIAHGIAAAGDRNLLEEIVRKKIPLDLAITSNLATGAVATLESHPARALFLAGARLTISSDDPPYFSTTITQEAALLVDRLGFSVDEADSILDLAFEVAFDREAANRTRNNFRRR